MLVGIMLILIDLSYVLFVQHFHYTARFLLIYI